jgi:hypothetical protein
MPDPNSIGTEAHTESNKTNNVVFIAAYLFIKTAQDTPQLAEGRNAQM